MKVSQLIEKLLALAATHGDLEVLVYDGTDHQITEDPEYNNDMSDDPAVILIDIS